MRWMEINGHQQMIRSDNVVAAEQKEEEMLFSFFFFVFISLSFRVQSKRQTEFYLEMGSWNGAVLQIIKIKMRRRWTA